MSPLQDCLDRLAHRPLGTVVHVQPSETEVILRYGALGARRVVLVVGDAEAVPPLRRLLPGRPWLEIVEAVVAPKPGPASWLRYSVTGLGGLLEADGLRNFYPRLRLLDRTRVEAVALQSVLEGLQAVPTAEHPNLLVLETPGLDEPLLRSLAPATLAAYGWVLLRTARQDLYRGGALDAAALEMLRTHHYRHVHTSRDSEPLWPVTLSCYDPAAAERSALTARVTELQAQVASLTSQRDEQARLATASALQVEQLTRARDEYARQATEHQQRVARLDAEATDLAARYGLLQEDLIKAEAHVELISDLLFRESVR